jgi:DNA replication protein DnaC
MNPADIDLPRLLRRLHLPTIARQAAAYETQAVAEGWSHRDYLAVLVAQEVANRNDTRIRKATRAAHFPYLKTIEEYDFVFQSTVSRRQLGPFLGPELVTEGRNLILHGEPGRGKTHLSIAIAYRAIQNGFTARFVTASDLIDELSAASKAGRLREATRVYTEPDVLVCDEVGYLQHADDAANVLYGVVDQRCLLRRPILFTTNKRLKDWGRVLHDAELAQALLDRVLERGVYLKLGGKSWRTKHIDDPDVNDASAETEPKSP